MPTNAPRRLPPWWLLLGNAVAVLIVWWQGPAFVASLRPERTLIVDFIQEWCGARNYLAGYPIYEPLEKTINRELRQFRNPADPMWLNTNMHPPVCIMASIPLGQWDYPEAMLVWNLLGLTLWGVSLALVQSQLGLFSSWSSFFPFLASLLVCYPFRQQVEQGQLNFVLLALLTGAWVADRSDASLWAGVCSGLAAALKLFPGLFLIYYLVTRRWKTAVTMGLVLLVTHGLAVVFLGVDAVRHYFLVLLPEASREGMPGWPNASIPGLCSKLFLAPPPTYAPLWYNPPFGRALTLVLQIALLAILVRSLWRVRTLEERDQGYAATLVAMLLLSVCSWEHYLVLLLMPLALLWVRKPKTWWERVALGTILACFWVPTVWVYQTFIPGGLRGAIAQPWQIVTVLSFQLYALLGLLALLLARIPRDRSLSVLPLSPSPE